MGEESLICEKSSSLHSASDSLRTGTTTASGEASDGVFCDAFGEVVLTFNAAVVALLMSELSAVSTARINVVAATGDVKGDDMG